MSYQSGATPEYRLARSQRSDAPQIKLDKHQRAVLEHVQSSAGPLLVLAGPGTGKTTTMVELVADQVANGLNPDDALVLTFSRKAAEELRARIARRIGGGAVVRAMTFHSYCYGLIRSSLDPEQFSDPLRLLSAPEQQARLAEILVGAVGDGRVQWPEQLSEALSTRGITREIADFLSTARSYGLAPAEVFTMAADRDEPTWQALAQVWAEYDDVLALANETDYSGLVDAARQVLHSDDAGAVHQPRLLVVDEFQDTDSAQTDLLTRLIGPNTDFVAVGDPDQSIYAFRGADVRGMWEFADRFGTPARPAATVALRRSRRSGPELTALSRHVIEPIGVSGSMSARQFKAFRDLKPADSPGRIEAPTFTDVRAEAEHIAIMLARAHLEDAVPYEHMAVLVRSVAGLAPIERALREADVPVEVAGDEIPLAQQPAVQALTQAAGCAQYLAQGLGLLPEQAEALLMGPIGRLDPSGLRALARVLRRHHLQINGELADSRELIAAALTDPVLLIDLETSGDGPDIVRSVRRLAVLIQTAARQILENAAAEQVLWTLWDGTSWPTRLRAAAESGHDEAHRDLDALVALFADAARTEERVGHVDLGSYLDGLRAQQIPSDTLTDRGIRGRALRLMTAHRSKGLEWQFVVVAGVQDGVWPSVRPQHSILRTERLDPRGDGRAPTFGASLAEERRLFYVAITRAQQRLAVTAVQSPVSDGDQPSRFHEQVRDWIGTNCGTDNDTPSSSDDEPSIEPQTRPQRGATLRGITVELRQLAEHGSSPAVRASAARRLADLAESGVGPADPKRWWGVTEVSKSDAPVRPVDQPLQLSGTAVDGLSRCALQWFLAREARGEQGESTSQSFGKAIHLIAEELLTAPHIEAAALLAQLDSVWHHLDFDTPWISDKERDQAHQAVTRLIRWHRADERTPLGAEVRFDVEVAVPGAGGVDTVRLNGSMDRVEIDDDGRVHVVDFKTGKTRPSKADLQVHPQLGVYQLAIAAGAMEGHSVSGGAELVHLRAEYAAAPGLPVVQAQLPPDPEQPFFAAELVANAAATVRGETFAATTGPACNRCAFRSCCPAVDEGQPTVRVAASGQG